MEYKYNDLLKDKRAVLFDLDGTLVDSMWVWRNIDIDFLSAIGKELPDDLQKEIEGMSFTETAEYFKKPLWYQGRCRGYQGTLEQNGL